MRQRAIFAGVCMSIWQDMDQQCAAWLLRHVAGKGRLVVMCLSFVLAKDLESCADSFRTQRAKRRCASLAPWEAHLLCW